MKVIVFFFLVAAVSASTDPECEVEMLRNVLDELVRKTFLFVKRPLQRHEPLNLPPLPELQLVDTDAKLSFSTSNLKLTNAEDLTVDKMSNDRILNTFSFEVTVLKAHLEGDYVVSGSAFQKDVQKSGTFSVDIENFVQTEEVQYVIYDHTLQIQELTIDYSIAGAKYDIEELDMEGLTKEQVENMLNKSLLDYLQQHEAEFAQEIAAQSKTMVNQQLKDHSLQGVINWLKKVVASFPPSPPSHSKLLA